MKFYVHLILFFTNFDIYLAPKYNNKLKKCYRLDNILGGPLFPFTDIFYYKIIICYKNINRNKGKT